MSFPDSSVSLRQFIHSDTSFDFDHVSDFDYEPVDFNIRAIPFEGTELCVPKPLPEEHTLVMIKPCALKFAAEIKKRVQDEGFTILKIRILRLSPEMISEFFYEHYGKTWFPKAVIKLSRSPVMVMALAKDRAIEDFKELMGPPRVSVARKIAPYSLRALYGLKGDFATNGIHGSENRENALREIHFFFPQAIPEPLSSVMSNMDYYKERFQFLLIKSIGELYKYKSPNLLMWLTNWLENHNPEVPRMQVTYPTIDQELPSSTIPKKCKITF